MDGAPDVMRHALADPGEFFVQAASPESGNVLRLVGEGVAAIHAFLAETALSGSERGALTKCPGWRDGNRGRREAEK